MEYELVAYEVKCYVAHSVEFPLKFNFHNHGLIQETYGIVNLRTILLQLLQYFRHYLPYLAISIPKKLFRRYSSP